MQRTPTYSRGRSNSPMSIIDDLVDMEIFERDPAKCAAVRRVPRRRCSRLARCLRPGRPEQEHARRRHAEHVLREHAPDSEATVPGDKPQLRAINSYLLVDEADNIMRYEFDVLRKLLLQGREFGCGVILASQYLRHFKVNATDYREPLLTWFIHKVPNVTPAELATLGLAASAAEVAERVKSSATISASTSRLIRLGRSLGGCPSTSSSRWA